MRLITLTLSLFVLSQSVFAKDYIIEEVKVREWSLLVVRHSTTVTELTSNVYAAAFKKVETYTTKKGLKVVLPPLARFTRYEPPLVDVEIGMAIEKADAGEGDVVASTIPAGDYIRTIHTGPYETMAPAYNALHKWMEDHGKKNNGAPYEVYLNDPATVKPEEIQTAITYPIK